MHTMLRTGELFNPTAGVTVAAYDQIELKTERLKRPCRDVSRAIPLMELHRWLS